MLAVWWSVDVDQRVAGSARHPPPVKRRIPLGAARRLGAAMEFVYRVLSLKGEPRLTRLLASELAMSHHYDLSRAKQDLGYTPQWTMDDALEKTLVWLRKEAQ